MFNDDWDLSIPLYPSTSLPPITLLVILVGNNIYFDPSKEEVSVADVVLAISLGVTSTVSTGKEKVSGEEAETRGKRNFHLLAVRTIDPPSRLTMHGVPDRLNNATATGASASAGVLASAGVSASAGAMATAASKGTKGNMDIVQRGEEEGVWIPPRGGMKRGVVGRVLNLCVRENGVASEVLEGLDVFVSGSV